jgi:hypothetical protein
VTTEYRNPPRFRQAPSTPAESLNAGRCETCASFWNVGFCNKYQLPVDKDNLCDSYISILKSGKRQWAEP